MVKYKTSKDYKLLWKLIQSGMSIVSIYNEKQNACKMLEKREYDFFETSYEEFESENKAVHLQFILPEETTDEFVLLPKELTAENGMKHKLSGEFVIEEVHWDGERNNPENDCTMVNDKRNIPKDCF